MRETLEFVHIIAAMVFFGIPFAFGRWYRTVAASGSQILLQQTLQRFRWLSLYIYLAALIILITGLWLTTQSNYWASHTQRWVYLALGLMGLSLLNLIFILTPAIAKTSEPGKTGARLLWFSAIHHTLVTLLTMLMVFKPF